MSTLLRLHADRLLEGHLVGVSTSSCFRGRLLALGLAVALAAGCAPKIHSFSVSPLALCPQDDLRVDWDVAGSPSISIRQLPPAEGDPGDLLAFTLLVERRGETTQRTVEVMRLAAAFTTEIVFATERQRNALVASGVKDPERWGGPLRVLTVASASSVALRVDHEGTSARLDADGSPTSEFEGTRLSGQWEFWADATAALDELSIKVDVRCGTTGQ